MPGEIQARVQPEGLARYEAHAKKQVEAHADALPKEDKSLSTIEKRELGRKAAAN